MNNYLTSTIWVPCSGELIPFSCPIFNAGPIVNVGVICLDSRGEIASPLLCLVGKIRVDLSSLGAKRGIGEKMPKSCGYRSTLNEAE